MTDHGTQAVQNAYNAYNSTGLAQAAAIPPSIRGVCARLEELHKEADTLLGLACDLVGHEPESAEAKLQAVPGSLVDQIDYSVSQLWGKLRSAREKFQRGHG